MNAGIEIPEDAVFKKTVQLEIIEAGQGFVLYDERHDRVHFLNPTAVVVYDLCENELTLSEIAEEICHGFSLDTSPLGEIRECLKKLEKEKLVRRL